MAQPKTEKKNVTPGKPTRTPVDKRAKFLQLGTRRVNKVIKGIRQIGNLATYDYKETEVEQIFMAIDKEIKRAALRFKEKGRPVEMEFKFLETLSPGPVLDK